MSDFTTKTRLRSQPATPRGMLRKRFARRPKRLRAVKESFEKMSAATAEATALIKDSYSTAKCAEDTTRSLLSSLKTIPRLPSTSSKNCRA